IFFVFPGFTDKAFLPFQILYSVLLLPGNQPCRKHKYRSIRRISILDNGRCGSSVTPMLVYRDKQAVKILDVGEQVIDQKLDIYTVFSQRMHKRDAIEPTQRMVRRKYHRLI